MPEYNGSTVPKTASLEALRIASLEREIALYRRRIEEYRADLARVLRAQTEREATIIDLQKVIARLDRESTHANLKTMTAMPGDALTQEKRNRWVADITFRAGQIASRRPFDSDASAIEAASSDELNRRLSALETRDPSVPE